MKRTALIVLLALSPAAAQEAEDAPEEFTRGIEQVLRDLFSEVEPTLRELRDRIDDLNNYEPPEMLPNGDIIIRRKRPLAPSPGPEQPEPDADGPIEL